ncbi:MAG TPA: hypothetical protein VIH22_07370 [Cyclobacteriaceae bacterium]
MHIEFDRLPDYARIWVYLSDRKFTVAETGLVGDMLRSFANEWAAHGTPLQSSCRIKEDQFIILAVDEQANGASGCSIDTSVNAIKRIGGTIGADLFNRALVPFSINNEVLLMQLNELKQKYREGVWNGRTLTFNILAKTVGEIREMWTMPAEKSWVSRYMEPRSVDSLAG